MDGFVLILRQKDRRGQRVACQSMEWRLGFLQHKAPMKILPLLLPVVCCMLFVSCASTSFSPWEGDQVIEGTGGTKETVGGVDIWRDGTPPRKYKVIGIIDDVRRDSWMVGSGKNSLAKKAAEVGGDGIIILDSRREVVGLYNPGQSGTVKTTGNPAGYHGQTTFQTHGSTSTAIRDKITKAAVIKYVD